MPEHHQSSNGAEPLKCFGEIRKREYRESIHDRMAAILDEQAAED